MQRPFRGPHAACRYVQLGIQEPHGQYLANNEHGYGQDNVDGADCGKGLLELGKVPTPQLVGQVTAGGHRQGARQNRKHADQASHHAVNAIVHNAQHSQDQTARVERDEHHHNHADVEHDRVLGDKAVTGLLSFHVGC